MNMWRLVLGITMVFFGAGTLFANQAKLEVSLSHPTVLAAKKRTVYLKVGLTGFQMARSEARAQVNLAIVLDRSGSMSGEKLYHAKLAAKMVVEMLKPDDILSVIAYDDVVRVILPATKVSDKEVIKAKIDRIRPGGSTALFYGVSKGISEVRKFLSKNRVNRVILLSDGLANVGPSSPNALGRLGAAAGRVGVAITTVGLGSGYNEDLMTQLAQRSDGNHGFARTPQDLARIFKNELGDVLSVVAQEVTITVECKPGFRPVRVLERQAEIKGQKITIVLNQLYSKQEKYVLLELEVPSGEKGVRSDVATVKTSYANMATKTVDKLQSTIALTYTTDAETVDRRLNRKVMVDVVEAIANENAKRAIMLRDRGKVDGAHKLLLKNYQYLNKMGNRYRSPKLLKFGKLNLRDSNIVQKRGKWNVQRKRMKKSIHQRSSQQSW